LAIKRGRDHTSIEPLYVTVLATNNRAHALYKKLGFNTFGIELQSVNINDTLIDERQMIMYGTVWRQLDCTKTKRQRLAV
jgi:RimJ/RimL family protein N-acetyltransferase